MITKGYAPTARGQVHYRESGGPETPLLLLHQNASSSAAYEKVMQRLEGWRRLLALDTPGFGESFTFEFEPTMNDYADSVVDVLDALDVPNACLFGHHAGSILAANVAHRYPDRIEAVVLSAPACLTSDERLTFSRQFGQPIPALPGGDHLAACWAYVGALGADADLALHTREALETARSATGRLQNYRALWQEDYCARLEALYVPVYLMCSDTDALWPFFDRARAIRPDAPVAVVGGGNFSSDLDPAGVAAAIRAFIESRSDAALAFG